MGRSGLVTSSAVTAISHKSRVMRASMRERTRIFIFLGWELFHWFQECIDLDRIVSMLLTGSVPIVEIV